MSPMYNVLNDVVYRSTTDAKPPAKQKNRKTMMKQQQQQTKGH